MLQVILDPSLIAKEQSAAGTKADIAITISGISWQHGAAFPETPTQPPAPDIDKLKKFIYPWGWSGIEIPVKFKLYWVLTDNTIAPGYVLLDVAAPVLPDFAPDLESIKYHYDSVYSKRLFPNNTVSDLDLCWNYDTANNREIEFSDSAPVDNAGQKTNTGFFISAISKCGQALPPLNQVANLVYFCKQQPFTIPDGSSEIKGFVIFPFDGQRWAGDIDIPEHAPNDSNLYRLVYDEYNDIRTTVYCPVTPLALKPTEEELKNPIQLRDEHANFLGHLNLKVNDTEDQIPSIVFAAGHFFNLPVLFLDFLNKNKSKIYKIPEQDFTKYKDWLQLLNNFLWSSVRDSLGFGFKSESDGGSLEKRIVRQYCSEYGKVKDGSISSVEAERQEYWKQFSDILKEFSKTKFWQQHNSKNEITSQYWNNIFDPEMPGDYLKCTISLVEEAVRKYGQVPGLELARMDENIRIQISRLQKIELEESADTDKWVDQWVENWSLFLTALQQNPILPARIIFCQWKKLPLSAVLMKEIDISGLEIIVEPVPNESEAAQREREGKIIAVLKQLKWYETVFSTAGELSELQKEALGVGYKEKIIQELKTSLDIQPEMVTKNILGAISDYCNDRIDDTKEFYPEITDPFKITDWQPALTWTNFLASLEFISNPAEKSTFQKDIEVAAKKVIEIPFNIPPNVQLQVDKFENTDPGQEDLNDEIAGNIVLMRRANSINNDADFTHKAWRYLNWAKVQAVSDPSVRDLEQRYISPVFLPETEGYKNSFLQISNEKLSLVSGHETNKEDNEDEEIPDGFFKYHFDENHQGYALWYGYHYKFAGFVALNSGVLPKLIRSNPDSWNIPLIDDTELEKRQFPHEAPYPHLRRVPVSKVRIATRKMYRNTAQDIRAVPKGLLPLAFELAEWKTNILASKINPETQQALTAANEAEVKQNEQVYYLLAEGNEIEGEYNQSEIQLALKKPTTSFWNWYAWLGNEGNIITDQKFPKRKDSAGIERNTDQSDFMLDEEQGKFYRVDAVGHRVEENGNYIESDPFKRIKHLGLEKELTLRTDSRDGKTPETKNPLIDPAIGNSYIITLEKLFPEKNIVTWGKISIPADPGDNLFLFGLKDTSVNLKIRTSQTETTGIRSDPGSEIKEIIIQSGDVARIKIYCIIKQSFFKKQEGGEQRFHEFMTNLITSADNIPGLAGFDDYFLTKPQEVWLEAAVKPRLNQKQSEPLLQHFPLTDDRRSQEKLNTQLWTNLDARPEPDKIIAFLKKNADYLFADFAYTSRTEIRHQVWNWNGRLDESELLGDGLYQNPEAGVTTPAMEWEAWAFSDRPDFSALSQETNLIAYRHKAGTSPADSSQDVFTDLRPGEQKALYYRFTATLYSRYELLGESFAFSIESKKVVDQVADKWRRHLRKCTRVTSLPKPSIRFVIPLTKSIQECKDELNIPAASLLVVLDDKWFTEAGLAEKLELGIEILKKPGKEDVRYLNAGNDPILTGKSLGSVQLTQETEMPTSGKEHPYIEYPKGKNAIMVLDTTGPVGLTFDFAAQTPKLKGCAFIVKIPDLKNSLQTDDSINNVNELKPWALMQIAVRRALREKLCETENLANSLYSEWTAKEWVQFLPAVDSFIPTWWRKAVALNDYVSIKFSDGNKKVAVINTDGNSQNDLPEFDAIFEDLNQRFLVLTEKIYDIGGRPCERYIGTYLYNRKDQSNRNYSLDHPDFPQQLSGKVEGYVRILLVRKTKDYTENPQKHDSVWERLFGSSVNSKPDMQAVQNDPTAALPLVSERIPFKTV
ncbi:MAG: hypothetical protein ABIN94_22785 [Ferruginibacter sp.]